MSVRHVFTATEWQELQPAADGYRSVEHRRRGESTAIEALPHIDVAVADILAPVD